MIRRLMPSTAGPSQTNGSIRTDSGKNRFVAKVEELRHLLIHLFVRIDLLFLAAGFLLGRSVILSGLAPFATPFFAMLFWRKQRRRWPPAFAVVVGAFTVSAGQAFYSLLALFFFLVLRRLMLSFSKKTPERLLAPLVFFATVVARLVYETVMSSAVLWSHLLTAVTEGALSFLLTLIFMQSLPLIASKVHRKYMRNEEVICAVILISSLLIGTSGWTLSGLSADHILAQYAVLLFAYSGGATIGATVGVVIGLILSMVSVSGLYLMSLLGFSGVLGGLLKESGKAGTSGGLFIASLLIGLYGGGLSRLDSTLLESLLAVFLFLLTPKVVTSQMAALIPGTYEYRREQQQYVRKLRDATVSRVEQFAGLFRTLAGSFHPSQSEADGGTGNEELFFEQVAAKTCRNCFRKEQCWLKNAERTRRMMLEIREETKGGKKMDNPALRRAWRRHCRKSEQTIAVIGREQVLADERAQIRRKLDESRELVAAQLQGISQIMGDFAGEMKRERGMHERQEELVVGKLHEMGIQVESVEIYNLESGSIDIEVLLPEDHYGICEKVIAPVLSDLLGETIRVDRKQSSELPNVPCRAVFASAKKYVIETGAATAARGGGPVSGDNYCLFEIGSGKYALAISDGMGSGARADTESRDTLDLLANVLRSGIHETLAIKSINSILSLRSTEEIFATLDLAIIDLQDATSKILKIGSNPSFIKRGSRVMMMDGGNLPIGMITDLDVEVTTKQLKSGDLLIMMSDGLFDVGRQIENKEIWLRRKIRELETDDPQEVADLLLEEVIRTGGGRIDDDMTVIVARIRHHMPKWSSISGGMQPARMRRAE